MVRRFSMVYDSTKASLGSIIHSLETVDEVACDDLHDIGSV